MVVCRVRGWNKDIVLPEAKSKQVCLCLSILQHNHTTVYVHTYKNEQTYIHTYVV